MSQLANTALSVLDLAPIRQGGSAAETFQDSVALAQHTERLGYQRYWLAEHHNIAGIASAATAVLIGHVAGQTSTIRVGSGGIMLPNHPHWWWPSSSAPWRRSTPAGSTWGWAVPWLRWRDHACHAAARPVGCR